MEQLRWPHWDFSEDERKQTPHSVCVHVCTVYIRGHMCTCVYTCSHVYVCMCRRTELGMWRTGSWVEESEQTQKDKAA